MERLRILNVSYGIGNKMEPATGQKWQEVVTAESINQMRQE